MNKHMKMKTVVLRGQAEKADEDVKVVCLHVLLALAYRKKNHQKTKPQKHNLVEKASSTFCSARKEYL